MILCVFPFKAELEAFAAGAGLSAVGPVRGYAVHSLDPDNGWRLAVGGQGKVETALACQALSDAFDARAILLLGSATALDPALRVGDCMAADPGLEWDFGTAPYPRFRPPRVFPETPEQPKHPAASPGHPENPDALRLLSGPILSGDRDLFDPAEKARLLGECRNAGITGPAAAAWEGAGFHRFLRKCGKPGWEVRLITESAHEGRVSLEELRTRMRRYFPALRQHLESLLDDGRWSGPAVPD